MSSSTMLVKRGKPVELCFPSASSKWALAQKEVVVVCRAEQEGTSADASGRRIRSSITRRQEDQSDATSIWVGNCHIERWQISRAYPGTQISLLSLYQYRQYYLT